jgi:hypothetical protein
MLDVSPAGADDSLELGSLELPVLPVAPPLLLPQALRTNAAAPTAATAAISRRVDRDVTRLPPYR